MGRTTVQTNLDSSVETTAAISVSLSEKGFT